MAETMYPPKVNSPYTVLSAALSSSGTTVSVSSTAVFPDAPNLATIGVDDTAETILYTGKGSGTLTGVTRGFEGTAKEWPAGMYIARVLTAYDIESVQQNISDILETLEGGLGVTDHSELDNLNWSEAGHTIDANVDMGANSLTSSTGDLNLNAATGSDIKVGKAVDMNGQSLKDDVGDLNLDAATGYDIKMGKAVDMNSKSLKDDVGDLNLDAASGYDIKMGKAVDMNGNSLKDDAGNLNLNAATNYIIRANKDVDLYGNTLYSSSGNTVIQASSGNNVKFRIPSGKAIIYETI